MKLQADSEGFAIAPPDAGLEGADARGSVLERYGFDSLEEDPELASIAKFAGTLCNTPIALVSLVEEERQRFLAKEGLDVRDTPRSDSFCAHTMQRGSLMVVTDTHADPRFRQNSLVVEKPGIRFYAGFPLVTEEGVPLGALCVIDDEPRPGGLTSTQQDGLRVLGNAVMRRLTANRDELTAKRRMAGVFAHTRQMIDLVPQIAFSIEPDGRFSFYNRQFRRFTDGEPPQDSEGWRSLIHIDDHDPTFPNWYDAFEKGIPFEAEFRMRNREGKWRWMLARTNPVGKSVKGRWHWFGTLTDIDDAYRESESRDLLARELSHRIKNIFAVISSLVAIRSRGKPQVREFANDLTQTIGALGRAHDYVRPLEGRKGDSLHGLLDDLLAPYRHGENTRIQVLGEDSAIGARAATPLALVIHELATNSAKYGALSSDVGTIDIDIATVEDGKFLRIVWQEDCPTCRPAAGPEGFGSRLIQLAVQGQLDGRIERSFEDRGLRAELVVSIEALAS